MHDFETVFRIARTLEEEGHFALEKKFKQHGEITVFDHSVHVAFISLKLADQLPFTVDRTALVRGALLHDYFLYDWHKESGKHGWHGLTHPDAALRNAKRDFILTEKEEDIIVKHMFPLTLRPPKYKESWIVCAVDKGCAVFELVFPDLMRRKERSKL